MDKGAGVGESRQGIGRNSIGELHKVRSLPKDQFKPEGKGRNLRGRKTNRGRLSTFKLSADFLAQANLATAIRNCK
jgi:hypothetical protein